MELLKVLAMPFQLASLLYVAASSLLMGFLLRVSVGLPMILIPALFAIWLMLVLLTNYTLRLIDDAANGVRESAVASAEMMVDISLDSRAWVHPLIAGAFTVMHWLRPQWPVTPTLVAGALLLPASLGACTMTGHARDALNPVLMWRVVRGLGPWYPVVVVFVALCVLLGVILVQRVPVGIVLVASLQLLLLGAYAAIGGAIYERRFELGFDPRVSPERVAEKQEAERTARRQQFLDGLYNDLRMRKLPRALASAQEWLGRGQSTERDGDVHAILAAGRSWPELQDYVLLLQGLVSTLVELNEPALACRVAEAGLALQPEFRARTEAGTVALVRYAIETGRRRTATRILDNFLVREDAGYQPGPQLEALRERLRPPA